MITKKQMLDALHEYVHMIDEDMYKNFIDANEEDDIEGTLEDIRVHLETTFKVDEPDYRQW